MEVLEYLFWGIVVGIAGAIVGLIIGLVIDVPADFAPGFLYFSVVGGASIGFIGGLIAAHRMYN